MSRLDDEIVALHSEIVELQRSPFARRQGDVMQKLSVTIQLFLDLLFADVQMCIQYVFFRA